MSDSVPQVVGSYCITSTVMKCCHHHGKFYWTVEFSVLFDRSWWWQIPRDRVGSRVLCSSHWPCLEHRSNEEMAWKVYLFFRVFAEDPQRNTLCTPYYTEGRTQGLSTGVLDLGSLGLNVLLLTPLSLHFLIRKIRVILMSPSSQCWGIDVVLLQSHLAGSWNTLSAPMCQLLVLISYSFVIYLRSAIHVSRIRPHILKKYVLTCCPQPTASSVLHCAHSRAQEPFILALTSLHSLFSPLRRLWTSWKQVLCLVFGSVEPVSCPLLAFSACELLMGGYRMSVYSFSRDEDAYP